MINETSPLIPSTFTKWRWYVLFAFSFYSFTSAMMWATFAPCLYLFVDYYFHYTSSFTVNAVNSLSSVYMFTYPAVIHFTIYIFDNMTTMPGKGLKRIILYGGMFNTLGSLVRWLGASPSSNSFIILFIGQTIGSFGN